MTNVADDGGLQGGESQRRGGEVAVGGDAAALQDKSKPVADPRKPVQLHTSVASSVAVKPQPKRPVEPPKVCSSSFLSSKQSTGPLAHLAELSPRLPLVWGGARGSNGSLRV